MISKKRKNIISILLSVVLALSLFPVIAGASTTDGKDQFITGTEGTAESSNDEDADGEEIVSVPEDGAVSDVNEDSSSGESSPDSQINESMPLETQALKVNVDAKTVENETRFHASASGGHFDLTNEALFAVWSAEKGQDDIRWYSARHMPDGSWTIEAPLANHRSTGTYIVHAYARTNKGLELTGVTTFIVSTPKASAIRLFQLSAEKGTFTVYVDGVTDAPVKSVRVAVWATSGGQDDLCWYNTQKRGNSHTFGAYMAMHKGQTGLYVADVYVTLQSGLDVFIGRATANLEVNDGFLGCHNSCDKKITVVSKGGIYELASGILYAVWSTAGGQDDICWYRAYRQPDRSWPAAVYVSTHKTAGTYNVHVYGEFTGGMSKIGSTTFEIKPNTAANVCTSLNDNVRGSFLVTVSGIDAPSGISKVEIPIWTKPGQSDIIWYQAGRQSSGSYAVAVPATSFNLAENYSIHAYVTSENGIRSYVGNANGKQLDLDGFVKVDGSAGSGTRSVWMKNPPANVNYVYVWSASNGQDDLHSIPAGHKGDRVWMATIDCANLKHAGTCYADIYSGGKFYKRLSFNVAQSDLVPPAEQAMNNRVNGLSSRTGWLIGVDTNNCFVTVYNGSQGNWHAVRTFPCAPGKWSTPSKKGVYSVGIKGYVFGGGYSCYYYTQYSGNYLFHSILYNPGTFNVQDGTMGTPASHGCIRLWLENAKYIYDNVPGGSTVLVY